MRWRVRKVVCVCSCTVHSWMSLTHLILSFAAECPQGGVSPRPVLTSVPLSSVVTFAEQQLLQVLVFLGLQHHQCGAVCEGLCCVWGCVVCGVV